MWPKSSRWLRRSVVSGSTARNWGILSRLLRLDITYSKRDVFGICLLAVYFVLSGPFENTLASTKCWSLKTFPFFGHTNGVRRDVHIVNLLGIRFDIVPSTFDIRFFAQAGIYPSGLFQLLSLSERLGTRLVLVATAFFIVYNLSDAANIDERILGCRKLAIFCSQIRRC
ncbi:hypothetical protein KC333_g81 [Hortaea werneckii]|nr:hypothetical protein KC333_g81 [Hortaea werneckii]